MDLKAAGRSRFSRHGWHCKDDESRIKSFIFPLIVFFNMLWPAFLRSSCLKGIWRRSLKDTEMLLLCLFKNIGVKLVNRWRWWGRWGREADRGPQQLQFMQISCRCLSYPSNGRLNLFHWNIICTEYKCKWGEHKISEFSPCWMLYTILSLVHSAWPAFAAAFHCKKRIKVIFF